MFVGRTKLLKLIDGLITIPPNETKPVLVLEGSGGSGRTAMLDQVLRRWHEHTPAVLVRPLERPYDEDNPARPVHAAVMLGLSAGIPGFRVSFPRVVVALIAIQEDFTPIAPPSQRKHLRSLLNQYENRKALIEFIGSLIDSFGTFAASKVPGAAVIAPAVTKNLSAAVVRRLQHGRWLARITWGPAVSWFGHQDLGLVGDAEGRLIELSLMAKSEDPAIRRGVDDVLVSALLADLRHSAAKVGGRASNLVVLIDDGDVGSVVSFIGSLLRARQALAAVGGAVPDPLTVITASSGVLATELAGQVPTPAVWSDPLVPGVAAPWVRLRLPDLRSDQVETLAKNVNPIRGTQIGARVFRLTGGHPAATALLLGRIKENLDLATDLDALLRASGPEPGTTVQQYLLRVFVRGLSVHRQLTDGMVEALITVSAARTKREALGLEGLLPAGIETDSPLYTSTSLWVNDGAEERLPPLVRQLGLRELRVRTNPATGWERVFRALLNTVDAEDRAGKLLYSRLLYGRTAIVGELGELLSQLPAPRWLVMFDEIVSVLDPQRPDRGVIENPDNAHTRNEHLEVLLSAIPELSSGISFVTTEARSPLFSRIAHSYDRLAEFADDRGPFVVRADEYRHLKWMQQ